MSKNEYINDFEMDIPGAYHEHRISLLESNRTIVISDPIIPFDTLPIGGVVHFQAFCESLLNPPQIISHFVLIVPELKIHKEYVANKSGYVTIPLYVPSETKIGSVLNFTIYAKDRLGNTSRIINKKVIATVGSIETPTVLMPKQDAKIYVDCISGLQVIWSDFNTKDYEDTYIGTMIKITSDIEGNNIIVKVADYQTGTGGVTEPSETYVLKDITDFSLYDYINSDLEMGVEDSYISTEGYHVKDISSFSLYEYNYAERIIINDTATLVQFKDIEIGDYVTDEIKDLSSFSLWEYINNPKEIIKVGTKKAKEFTFKDLNLEEGREYYIHIRQKGELFGYSKWSEPVRFIAKHIRLLPVQILTPTENEIIVTKSNPVHCTCTEPTIEGCDYPSQKLTWKLCSDSNGENVIHEFTVSTESMAYTMPRFDLLDGEKYYIFARYWNDKYGYSDWSRPVGFYEKLGTIVKPEITNPTRSELIITNLYGINVVSSIYNCIDYTDSHKATEYKITYDIFGQVTLFEKKINEPVIDYNLLPAMLEFLEDNKIYYIWVRYIGIELKPSEWSEPIPFRTKIAHIEPPSILTPMDNSRRLTNCSVEINSSAFNPINATDTHLSTDWKITRDYLGEEIVVQDLNNSTDKISHTFNNLTFENNILYYVFARYKGEVLGYSEWSYGIRFKAVTGIISQCQITEPANNSTILYNVTGLTVRTSAYTCEGISDGHDSTDWKITRDITGQDIVKEVLRSYNKTEFTFDKSELKTILEKDTVYYVWARHNGVLYEQPIWSNPVKFTTLMGSINTPIIESPVNSTTINIGNNPIIISSDFTTINLTDIHELTDWKLCSDNEGNNIILHEDNSRDNLESWTINSRLLIPGTYYVFCRYKGSTIGYSEWNNPLAIIFEN